MATKSRQKLPSIQFPRRAEPDWLLDRRGGKDQ
jgi:hypothetical protein